MYPNSIDFGLNVVPIYVLQGQCIYYLGTWNIRVLQSSKPEPGWNGHAESPAWEGA